jgi:hypothetical protein
MGKEYDMIKQVQHEATAPVGPAKVSLALAVAYELHASEAHDLQAPETYERRAPRSRAPELVVPQPQLMGLRTSAARPHRRKVPLHRLTVALS